MHFYKYSLQQPLTAIAGFSWLLLYFSRKTIILADNTQFAGFATVG